MNTTNFIKKEEALNHLAQKLLLAPVGTEKEWDGANVIITSGQDNRASSSFYSQLRLVVTADAQELSWLLCQLRDIFLGL